MLIGWSDDGGELVGCVAVERSGPDDLEVRALTVPDDEAAAMLDALADVVTAERLLARRTRRCRLYAAAVSPPSRWRTGASAASGRST